MGPLLLLRVNLEVMEKKRYSTKLYLGLGPYHQINFSVISKDIVKSLSFYKGEVNIIG